MKRTKTMRMWMLIGPDGLIREWAGARRRRTDFKTDDVAGGLLGGREYDDLADTEPRWKVLKSRGYRCVRVVVTVEGV